MDSHRLAHRHATSSTLMHTCVRIAPVPAANDGCGSVGVLRNAAASCAGLHPPAQHISECWNAAEFFANKLLKDFRGVDDRQVAWSKQLKVGFMGRHDCAVERVYWHHSLCHLPMLQRDIGPAGTGLHRCVLQATVSCNGNNTTGSCSCSCLPQDLFTGLQAYVRINMPTGIKWNPAGGSIAAAKAAAGSAPAAAPAAAAPAKPSPAPGGPRGPPPPPPPPANLGELLLKERPGAKPAPAAVAGGGMQEVLKALNQVRNSRGMCNAHGTGLVCVCLLLLLPVHCCIVQ